MSNVRKLAAIRRQLAQIAALVAEIETEFEDRGSGDWVETAVAAEALGQRSERFRPARRRQMESRRSAAMREYFRQRDKRDGTHRVCDGHNGNEHRCQDISPFENGQRRLLQISTEAPETDLGIRRGGKFLPQRSDARRSLSGRLEALKIEANIDNPSRAKIPTPGIDPSRTRPAAAGTLRRLGHQCAAGRYNCRSKQPDMRRFQRHHQPTDRREHLQFRGAVVRLVLCSGYIDANNTGAGNAANNDFLWGDDAGYLQMALLSGGRLSKDRILVSYPWQVTSTAISTGVPVVTTWHHEGGNLYVSVNGGGTEASVASGNTINDLMTRDLLKQRR
ncbi:hypothetical protein X727_21305 [Mesorhizobium sp. L103C119B0]|uniref:hypothetical protein n=1 Tax=Mesorhizobium sp. L103C119B0 TaxID=1287085 RepID=UPI0003D0072D|nr:hypothetical protein [Mesorhizobium sp. L103C119B0]ESZ68678.1 hypothetical protein X727_21305 [Mesorhizobium sp. L103C119B0]